MAMNSPRPGVSSTVKLTFRMAVYPSSKVFVTLSNWTTGVMRSTKVRAIRKQTALHRE